MGDHWSTNGADEEGVVRVIYGILDGQTHKEEDLMPGVGLRFPPLECSSFEHHEEGEGNTLQPECLVLVVHKAGEPGGSFRNGSGLTQV